MLYVIAVSSTANVAAQGIPIHTERIVTGWFAPVSDRMRLQMCYVRRILMWLAIALPPLLISPWCLFLSFAILVFILLADSRRDEERILRNLGRTNYEREWLESGIDPKIRDAVLLYFMDLPPSHYNFVNPDQTIVDFAATIYEQEIRVDLPDEPPLDLVVSLAMGELGLNHAEDHGITQDMTFSQVCQRLQSLFCQRLLSLFDTPKGPTSGEQSSPDSDPVQAPPGQHPG